MIKLSLGRREAGVLVKVWWDHALMQEANFAAAAVVQFVGWGTELAVCVVCTSFHYEEQLFD